MRSQGDSEREPEVAGTDEGICPPATSRAPADCVLPPAAQGPEPLPPPRLRTPDRQRLLPTRTIDDLLEADHPARAVWAYAERLDLAPFYDRIRARGRRAGRPATDPRLLVALILYATLAGFTSDREIADLCARHDAFRWLAGGVRVNHHTLSDFRTDNLGLLEPLLEQSVGVLRQEGLTNLDRIAEDGVRVRASAGAASFRRRATLEGQLEEARAEARRLQQQAAASAAEVPAREEVASDASAAEGPSRRQQAAAKRQAEDRLGRLEDAMARLPELEAKIKPGEPKEARVSTTDPEATVMKMADGGYRPAYNVEYATACQGQVIVGVSVVTVGSDQGQLVPMVRQIEGRFGQRPREVLVDGGCASQADIEELQGGEKKCRVYMPVQKPKKGGVDPHERKPGDSEEVAEWRQRMGTQEAKTTYKERAATAELINAQARNRGLRLLAVRGLEKVKAVATWSAIAHNMARYFSLHFTQPVFASS